MKVNFHSLLCPFALSNTQERISRGNNLGLSLFIVCHFFPTPLSKSWQVDPLVPQWIAESWPMNGHSLTRADHLKFKISHIIIFTGPPIEGKLHLADEFACCEMGHGSRWPSKKQKITLELVTLSPGFLNSTLLPGSVNAQIRWRKLGCQCK